MSQSERDKRLATQTMEQFAALGRFVQEFELAVLAVRLCLSQLLGDGSARKNRMLNGVLYHQALTAAPLIDMLACVIFEMLEAEGDQFSKEERADITSIVGEVAKRLRTLCEIRNNLLHGTWFIGWASQGATDFPLTEGTVHRFTPSARGVKSRDKLPKSLNDLRSYIEDAKAVKQFMNGLLMCVGPIRHPVGSAFVKGTHGLEPRPTVS